MPIAETDDAAAIAAALDGAGRAYLVTPSSEQAEAQQRRFADLAVQAGVKHPSCSPSPAPAPSRRYGSCAITRPSSSTSTATAHLTQEIEAVLGRIHGQQPTAASVIDDLAAERR